MCQLIICFDNIDKKQLYSVTTVFYVLAVFYILLDFSDAWNIVVAVTFISESKANFNL